MAAQPGRPRPAHRGSDRLDWGAVPGDASDQPGGGAYRLLATARTLLLWLASQTIWWTLGAQWWIRRGQPRRALSNRPRWSWCKEYLK
jgi:hypothetical protein